MLPRLNPHALRALGMVLGTIALLCLAGYGWQAYQRQRSNRTVERPAQAHADSLALQAARREAFNKVFYQLAGQATEASRHDSTSHARYDALRRRLPAALPELPAQPARYRPGR